MIYTSDDEYLERTMKNWEALKNTTRQSLPKIYENATDEIKTIINMLVESEYQIAIMRDNVRRKNGANGIFADEYKKENAEIIKMIGF